MRRAREGIRCTNYQPVDYDRLQCEIAEHKLAGQASLLKLNCIQAASRQQKEQNLVKQHCIVWQHERARLATMRHQLQSDLGSMLVNQIGGDDKQLKQIFQDFSSFELALADDFIKFKENTTDAVWSLR